ncbi:DNA polymerase III subunit delta' [Leptothrix discophora]|uniref:DNA polymerase III subunit delta n=1 Tax=Leptothrix discophora TaxID=89 RepID=A0ABT9FZA6_LEPDI|nr:DNA polymerase III subunit delta' [Leptothrix discophora]MDP4299560.1 DNA polymerase III subunit delta' [Leptothrix discophora]
MASKPDKPGGDGAEGRLGLDAARLPWLADTLTRTLASQRSHALLVSGPSGVGQMAFALALAKSWLCETPLADRPQRLACGHCGSCHLVDERSHPDLRLIVPEALRGEVGLDADEPGEGDGEGKSKKAKPSQEIKVDQIRTAIGFSELTAGRASTKVMLLHPAEALNTISANALLKTLEEPPGALRFVLSTSSPQSLLPTIRSRCQAIVLPRPEAAPAIAWLAGQGVDRPEVLLAASGEQPLVALAMHQAGLDAAAWLALPERVAAGDVAAFGGWALPQLIETLQKLCHDRLLVSVGAAPRYFAGARLVPGDVARLTAWAADLRRQSRHADHPYNAGLALEALLAQARDMGAAPRSDAASARPLRAGGPIHSRP